MSITDAAHRSCRCRRRINGGSLILKWESQIPTERQHLHASAWEAARCEVWRRMADKPKEQDGGTVHDRFTAPDAPNRAFGRSVGTGQLGSGAFVAEVRKRQALRDAEKVDQSASSRAGKELGAARREPSMEEVLNDIKMLLSNEYAHLWKSGKLIDKELYEIVKSVVLENKELIYVEFVAELLGLSRERARVHFNSLLAEMADGPSKFSLATDGYNAHKNNFESASAFLCAAYEGRLGVNGDIDQSKLRQLDGPLMDALNLEYRGEARRAELRQILPTKSDRLDQILQRELGYIPQGEERKRVLTSLSRGHRVGTRKIAPR